MLVHQYAKDGESAGEFVMRFLSEFLTEERTDGWADDAAKRLDALLPSIVPEAALRKTLDWLLPDKILLVVRLGLERVGQLPDSKDGPGFLDNIHV